MEVLASLFAHACITNEELGVLAQPNAQRHRTALSKLTRLITALMLATLFGCATSPTGRTQFILISPDAAIIESEAAYMDTGSWRMMTSSLTIL